MRYGKLLMCVVPLLAAAACDDDGLTDNVPPEPAASVRFINAVPDTGTVDLRFVDQVENLPTLQGVAFRASSGFYQRVEPGQRMARIFPNSADAALTQVRLVDTTVVLVADARYTLVYAGRASGDQDQLAVLEDETTPPTPPTDNIAIKVLHLGVDIGNVDVYVAPATDSTDNADPIGNAVAVLSDVPYLGGSAYANVPVRPTGGDPEEPLYQFTVTAAGSTTPLFTAKPRELGEPATAAVGPGPGVQISGSVLTAVVASGSTPGTRQSTASNQTPTVFLIADKVLNQ